MTLTKAELADLLFEKVGLNKREAKDMVEVFFDEIRDALGRGDGVKLSGFGNFQLRDKPQRPGRNPKTGELSGWLQGAAWEYAYKNVDRLSLNQAAQSLQNCFRELNRLGITSVADFQTGEVNFAHRRVLAEMARGGNLTVRLNFYIDLAAAGDAVEQVKLVVEEIKNLPRSDLFRFAGFGERLVPGLGVDNSSLNPKGFRSSTEAKEKFRSLARYLAESNYSFQLRAPSGRPSQSSKARRFQR